MRIHHVALAAVVLVLPALAQTRATKPNADADWPMYNRDLGSTRFSPLTQLNTKNASDLKLAWSYKLRTTPAPAGRGAAAAEEPEDQGGLRAGGGRGGGVDQGRGSGPLPTVNPEAVTPHSEAFQAVIWHLLVSHPVMQVNGTKWESMVTKTE